MKPSLEDAFSDFSTKQEALLRELVDETERELSESVGSGSEDPVQLLREANQLIVSLARGWLADIEVRTAIAWLASISAPATLIRRKRGRPPNPKRLSDFVLAKSRGRPARDDIETKRRVVAIIDSRKRSLTAAGELATDSSAIRALENEWFPARGRYRLAAEVRRVAKLISRYRRELADKA